MVQPLSKSASAAALPDCFEAEAFGGSKGLDSTTNSDPKDGQCSHTPSAPTVATAFTVPQTVPSPNIPSAGSLDPVQRASALMDTEEEAGLGARTDGVGAQPSGGVAVPAPFTVEALARQAALRAIDGMAAVDRHVKNEVPVEQMTQVAAACARRAQSLGAGRTMRVLADAAAEAAVRQVEAEGQRISWDKVEAARAVALTATSADYESMLEKALHRVREKTLVIAVQGYKGTGLELELSLSTLGGDAFDISFRRGAQVSEVAAEVCALRCSPGSPVAVKLVGPEGSVLEPSAKLPEILDCEMAGAGGTQDMLFYSLSTLQGCTESAPWRELGLQGPSRWKHLPEDEFAQLFCMSKASFEQLPSWKQISLKKKHDLF